MECLQAQISGLERILGCAPEVLQARGLATFMQIDCAQDPYYDYSEYLKSMKEPIKSQSFPLGYGAANSSCPAVRS